MVNQKVSLASIEDVQKQSKPRPIRGKGRGGRRGWREEEGKEREGGG